MPTASLCALDSDICVRISPIELGDGAVERYHRLQIQTRIGMMA